MTKKFGRTYRLTIYPIDGGDPIIITLPFTVNFSFDRNINASFNTFSIDIYNLSETHRKRIYQDRNILGQYFTNEKNIYGDPTQSFNLIFEAGYDQLHLVFYGRMLQASSAREGTNIITRIEGNSGSADIAGTQVQTTLPAGITLQQVLLFLIGQFPNLKLGAIDSYPQVFNRPVSLNGPAWQLLKTYSAGAVYVDNGKIYILGNKGVLNNSFVIDDATGILQTPRRQQTLLSVTTLLETGVQYLGQQVQLQSTILPQFNSNYKVLGIKHQGMISAAQCGRAISTFALLAPSLYNGFGIINNPSTAQAA